MDDQAIVALYFARDESAIAETERTCGGYCRAIARNILPSPEDAEECVSDAYFAAWRSIPPQKPRRLAAYLGKLTRNLALNRFRGLHTEKRGGGQTALALSELGESVPGPSDTLRAVEEAELTAAIGAFLRAQPPARRYLFLRRYWYLDSIRDIALACGRSESQVASALHRMRKQLRIFLEKEGITP